MVGEGERLGFVSRDLASMDQLIPELWNSTVFRFGSTTMSICDAWNDLDSSLRRTTRPVRLSMQRIRLFVNTQPLSLGAIIHALARE